MNPTKSYNTLPEAARKVCQEQSGWSRAYPMALLAKLALDQAASVREAVAMEVHLNTPAATLELLA